MLDSALFLNLNSAAAAVSEEMRCSGAVNELGILSLPISDFSERELCVLLNRIKKARARANENTTSWRVKKKW